MTAYEWGTLVLALAALPAVLFVVLYAREMRHVKLTATTWHVFAFTSVIALVLLEELAMRLFGRYERHDTFIAVMVLAITALLWQRLGVLLRHQVLPRWRRTHSHKEV